jgi:NADP-dependent 3-hydroxy acid dehydrogenase YdfG
MGKYDQPARRPAVITGASSGIGAATATALAAAGHPVALGARRLDQCADLAERIRAGGGEAVAHPLDLTDAGSVIDFAKQVSVAMGPIEVLVSNAGTVEPGTVYEAEPERFGRQIDLNLLGAHRLVQAFVPGMVERRRGDVVFVSSDVAVRARPFMTAYAAGKWGLEGMAAALQMELEGRGVRASIVRPGPTWTGMGMDWNPDDTAQVIDGWARFGHARHSHFLRPAAVADVITAVVNTPRGVHLNLVEVSPEAPLSEQEEQ